MWKISSRSTVQTRWGWITGQRERLDKPARLTIVPDWDCALFVKSDIRKQVVRRLHCLVSSLSCSSSSLPTRPLSSYSSSSSSWFPLHHHLPACRKGREQWWRERSCRDFWPPTSSKDQITNDSTEKSSRRRKKGQAWLSRPTREQTADLLEAS